MRYRWHLHMHHGWCHLGSCRWCQDEFITGGLTGVTIGVAAARILKRFT